VRPPHRRGWPHALQLSGTNTLALAAGRPATGAVDAATCERAPIGGKDQRGHSRNTTTRGCDIGAYDTGGAC